MRLSQTLLSLLCSGAIIAGCASHKFTQASLAGTWVSEWNFISFTNTIAADGSYICDRVHTYSNGVWQTKRVFVQTKGTWRIQGRLVINTTTNITGSTRAKAIPVASGRILKLDANELVIKWDNNDSKSVWKKER